MDTAVDRPMSAVLRDIIGNLDRIVRGELRLATAEMRERLEDFTAVSAQLAAGLAAALLSLLFVLLAAMYAMALVVPLWLAALLTALFPAATAAVLLFHCRAQLARRPLPSHRLLAPGPQEIR